MIFISATQIDKANQRIQSYIYKTPLMAESKLSHELGVHVFLKLESQQISGSFKARGAFNKILSYPPSVRKEGYFVAASTGNHAAAFCTALRQLNLRGKVFLPISVSPSKLDFIKSFDIPFELKGDNSLHAEMHCREVAEANDFLLVHPYNDPEIIAGQGTIAIELIEQLAQMDAVVVPVGGGGLISGIATYLKQIKPSIKIVGCQPINSPEMVRSIEQGAIIREDITQPTLSDGTAGGMEQGAITFDIAAQKVDEWALISEEEMAAEIKYMMGSNQMIIEGAAALTLAYLRKHADIYQGQNVALIICGRRLSLQSLRKIICP